MNQSKGNWRGFEMAAGSGFLGKLKQFDAYPKTLEDFRIKTYGGAASKLEMSCSSIP